MSRSVLRGEEVSCRENHPREWAERLPRRGMESHKHSVGRVLTLSGDAASTGASRLAAISALRGGAGSSTIGAPEDALAIHAAHLTSVMLRRVDDAEDLSALLSRERFESVVVGPGSGVSSRTRDMVLSVLSEGAIFVVLDADALTSFEGDSARLFEAISGRSGGVVLTPHEGEFRRLFSDLDGGKSVRAMEASLRSGATVLLKGSDSVIASSGRIAINVHSSSRLATAGSGDVLAGMVAALGSGGMSAFDAASAAAWIHGECGVVAPRGLIAEDLPALLPRSFDAALSVALP